MNIYFVKCGDQLVFPNGKGLLQALPSQVGILLDYFVSDRLSTEMLGNSDGLARTDKWIENQIVRV